MSRARSSRYANGFRVRTATPSDADAIARLLGDFQAEGNWPRRGIHAATRTAFAARRTGGLHVHLATDTGGEPVGFASSWFTHDLGDGPGAWLSDLYVVPAWRRRGVGRALVAAVARLARRRGGVWMMWHAARRDRGARAFYASLGARERPEQVIEALSGTRFAALARSARN